MVMYATAQLRGEGMVSCGATCRSDVVAISLETTPS